MKKILCVCIGNSDRSPVMAAVLKLYLGERAYCESAGISENAALGGPASQFAISAARKIGLDISDHQKRQVANLDLSQYDLIICASDELAGQIVRAGVSMNKVWNAQIPNPWPVHFEQDYEQTMQLILGAMYKVVVRFF